MSRYRSFVVQLAVIAAICGLWAAPARADQLDDCVQGTDVPGFDVASVDWQAMVAGCTGIIGSGRWEGARLAWAHNNRGHAYRRLGQDTRAIADYDAALELDPAHVGALLNRAVARDRLGDHQGAIADYNRALRLDPNRTYAVIGRALAQNALAWDHYVNERASEGLALIEAALAQDRRNPDFLDTRAHILAALGRTDDAVETFEAAAGLGDADLVGAYQQALLRHGRNPGPVDGVYGAGTRTALAACVRAGCRLLDGPSAGADAVVASVDTPDMSDSTGGPPPSPAAAVPLPMLAPFHGASANLPQFAPAGRVANDSQLADASVASDAVSPADTTVDIADLLARAEGGGEFPEPPALAPWGPSSAQALAAGPSAIPALRWTGPGSPPAIPSVPALAPANRAPIVGISEL